MNYAKEHKDTVLKNIKISEDISSHRLDRRIVVTAVGLGGVNSSSGTRGGVNNSSKNSSNKANAGSGEGKLT